jgi:thiol:disulfide interchange protein DsbC
MQRRLTLLLALLTSLTACAAEPQSTTAPSAKPTAGATAPAVPVAAGEAAIRDTIAKVLPDMEIVSVHPAPFAGFAEVAVQGRIFYVSNDGKYLIHGNLLDVTRNENLTRVSEGVLRRGELEQVGPERRIIFAAARPRHRITVFTDVECGFCRKLHEQIADYNKAGITVEYLFYPRMGPGSEGFEQAIAVACSRDPRAALTRAKSGTPLPHARCENSVAADYALGQRVGVDGTPAVYAENGVQIGGYLPPAEMLEKLDGLKAAGAR